MNLSESGRSSAADDRTRNLGHRSGLSLSSALAIVKERPAAAAMTIILAVALSYWLWYGLTQRSFATVELFSFYAAVSILENGIAIHPWEGYGASLYHRGYVPHYSVAGAMALFGQNTFSAMLPSLLMALGTLWLVYLVARDILGRPWLGVMAAALLVALGMETYYATSPRMYMALQFFTTLAIYSSWRGYVKGEGRYQLLVFLAICAAMLSHKIAGALIVAIPFATMLTMWGMGVQIRLRRTLLNPSALVGVPMVGLTFLFIYFNIIPDYFFPHLPPVPAQDWLTPPALDPEWAGSGLSVSPSAWIDHIHELIGVLPYGMLALPVVIFLAISKMRAKCTRGLGGIIYLLSLLAMCSLAIVLVIQVAAPRFWFYVLPIYALLAGVALIAVAQSVGLRLRGLTEDYSVGRRALVCLLAVGFLFSFVLFSVARSDPPSSFVAFAKSQYGNSLSYAFGRQKRPSSITDLLHSGFGTPCEGWRLCDGRIAGNYKNLRPLVGNEDIVISSSTVLTRHYLGPTYGLLREKVNDDGSFGTFDQSAAGELVLIDSIDKLEALREEHRRVWVITHYHATYGSSPKTIGYLGDNYMTMFEDEYMTVYVNCLEPPCASPGGVAN